MATPWIDKVKKSKQLTVFPTSAVKRGRWAGVFTNALQEFNRISTTMKLGVTLAQSTVPPETNGLGEADVNFDVAGGKADFTVMGKEFSLNVMGEACLPTHKLPSWKMIRRKSRSSRPSSFYRAPR
jgi:hypothetical protein